MERAREKPMPDTDGKTYTVTVTFTVRPDTDEHLQDERAIRDEVESWIASLDADVHSVAVQRKEVGE